MLIRRFDTDNLPDCSCLVGDLGAHVAAVVDPCCDLKRYLTVAQAEQLEVRYVMLTASEPVRTQAAKALRASCGAKIYVAGRLPSCEECLAILDGDVIEFGTTRLRVESLDQAGTSRNVILAYDLSQSENEPVARFDSISHTTRR